MLSRKTTYGLKAALFLAKAYGQGPVLITELARVEQLPQKFLEAILLELRKNDILSSKKGKGGGYVLARPPADVTLGEIIRVLNGPLVPLPALPRTGRGRASPTEEEREVQLIMKEVCDAMSNILERISLADVIERAQSGQRIHNFMI